ncbi:MAG: hypothetical protein Q7U10_07460 [Thermodesulfovibrionia bacterium]|nr:hypothetical protein [Thermodesulfovibrionia bacterium]
MNSLNIDFRDNSLRVLKIKDDKVVSANLISHFAITDLPSAKDTLSAEISGASGKHGRINIILPQDTVNHSIQQIPRAGADDISMILRRMIVRELPKEEFTFGFREIAERKKSRSSGTQNILLEYVQNKDLSNYLSLLKECGLNPDIITSSLEGNIQLFKRLRPETSGNEAIIDIGAGYIEILIINNGNLIDYEKLPLLIDFTESDAGDESKEEQASKIKIYKIVDVLFNSITSYIKGSGAEGLSTLWVCGIGSGLTGITDAIASGFGITTSLLSDLDNTYNNRGAFSALSGISNLASYREIANFIPPSLLQKKKNLIFGGIIAACAAVYLAILITAYLSINKTENDLRTYIKNKEVTISTTAAHAGNDNDIYRAGKNTLFNMISASPSLYGVFSDIANLTPAGVRLEKIDMRIEKDTAILTVDAAINNSSESYNKALLTKFLSALESSERLKSISIPAIATSSTSDKESIISVRSSYEVVN